MLGKPAFRLFKTWGAVIAVALSLVGPAAAQRMPAASATAQTPAPGAARIWFYRDYEPYGSRNFAAVRLNGTSAGYVDPNAGVFYRDVAPGRYHITVDSSGTDVNQDKTIDLAPGEEAYAKILAAPMWEMDGSEGMTRRDTFYVTLVPPEIARAQLAGQPVTGRGG
jgi:hypothetical protein